MPQKKHKAEEIVAKLRQVDVLLSQGRTVGEAVRSIGVTQFTYYRWRKEFRKRLTAEIRCVTISESAKFERRKKDLASTRCSAQLPCDTHYPV
jgi:transposase-like protein